MYKILRLSRFSIFCPKLSESTSWSHSHVSLIRCHLQVTLLIWVIILIQMIFLHCILIGECRFACQHALVILFLQASSNISFFLHSRFSPRDTNLVLREFEKCGAILKHIPGPRDVNWMHILYQVLQFCLIGFFFYIQQQMTRILFNKFQFLSHLKVINPRWQVLASRKTRFQVRIYGVSKVRRVLSACRGGKQVSTRPVDLNLTVKSGFI